MAGPLNRREARCQTKHFPQSAIRWMQLGRRYWAPDFWGY